MIINAGTLLHAEPIKNMIAEKVRLNGASYGLAEAGYDIRLKQDIAFMPGPDGTSPAIKLDKKWIRGRFTLASTIEEFNMPNNLVGIVHDKSTWARKGISVFNTVIEPGWRGFLTLEMVFHGPDPVDIPAGTGIAQVLFHKLAQEAAYTGKYQNQEDKPIPAIFEKNTEETFCPVCGLAQFETPSGMTCPNGHGGA